MSASGSSAVAAVAAGKSADYPYKPRIFRQAGEWKAVCNERTPGEWMKEAHLYIKTLI